MYNSQFSTKLEILQLVMHFDLRASTIKLILEQFQDDTIIFENRQKGITLTINKDDVDYIYYDLEYKGGFNNEKTNN